MDAIIGGIIALLAAAVAALVTMVTFRIRRSDDLGKHDKEYAARWDARRQEAFTEYSVATKLVHIHAWNIAKTLGLGTSQTPVTREEGLTALNEAEVARGVKYEAVLLLGSQRTVEAARDWHAYAWDFIAIARGEVEHNDEQFMERRNRSFAARNRFVNAARAELGLAEVDLTKASPEEHVYDVKELTDPA